MRARHHVLRHAPIAAGVCLALAAFAPAATPGSSRVYVAAETPRPANTTDRIVVRLKEGGGNATDTAGARRLALSAGRSRQLATSAQIELAPVRTTTGGAHVLRLPAALTADEMTSVIERLRRDPSVLAVEPDYRLAPASIPTDPAYAYQWSLSDPIGGINVERVWSQGYRGKGVVIAVVDTGVMPHRDLVDPVNRLLPGYDFVGPDGTSSFGPFATANDGDARDADARDPGNWVEAREQGAAPFVTCPIIGGTPAFTASDWHGTRIAGIIAASADNGYGIAGIASEAQILPVRVMGKCGGYSSDIADGIRWAAGLAVGDAPANPTPARIINVSVSMRIDAACPTVLADAITEAEAAGSIVVKAAGNDGLKADSALTDPTSIVTPLNCGGGINVTALQRDGSDGAYSNRMHKKQAIAAPGGMIIGRPPANDPSSFGGILSLFNSGARGPESDAFAFVTGTSEAAAHVAGVLALMIAARPQASVDELKEDLFTTARAFATGSNCIRTAITGWESSCGAGAVDAEAAVQAARARPLSATPSGSASSSSAGGSATSAGGCTTGAGGKPDVLLVLLALIAGVQVARRVRG